MSIRRHSRTSNAVPRDLATPDSSGAPKRQSTTDPRLLSARHEFANAFGDLARGKRNWQLMAFALAALLSLVTLAYVRLASSVRIVPYVVEVDKLGVALAAREATVMRTPEDRLIAAQLAGFVRNVRTVLPASSIAAQVDMMQRGYALVDQSSSAAANLNSYFGDPQHDPRVLGQTLTRQVEVTGILPVPNEDQAAAHAFRTWKVRWTETELPLQAGVLTHRTAWEGYLTVVLRPPVTVDAVQENPLGIFITALNWTEITEPGAPT